MSRIGRKAITVPKGVEIKQSEQKLDVKGPKGQLSVDVPAGIGIELGDGNVA